MKIPFILLFIVFRVIVSAQEYSQLPDSIDGIDSSEVYKIDKPGTITFTVGAKIKGKVDKPQVMIFLPKEKSDHQQITIDRSFKEELFEPLPFVPVIE